MFVDADKSRLELYFEPEATNLSELDNIVCVYPIQMVTAEN